MLQINYRDSQLLPLCDSFHPWFTHFQVENVYLKMVKSGACNCSNS